MDSIWAALKTDWHVRGACYGTFNRIFFPVYETEDALSVVQDRFCNHCPVRGKCLNSALINHDEGFWGGTSTTQRRAMMRSRERAHCPLCSAEWKISVNPYEICLSCGASWKAGHPPNGQR